MFPHWFMEAAFYCTITGVVGLICGGLIYCMYNTYNPARKDQEAQRLLKRLQEFDRGRDQEFCRRTGGY